TYLLVAPTGEIPSPQVLGDQLDVLLRHDLPERRHPARAESVEAVGRLLFRSVDDELDQEVLVRVLGRLPELDDGAAVPQRRAEPAGTGFEGEGDAGGESGCMTAGAVPVEEQHGAFGGGGVTVEGGLCHPFDVDLPPLLVERLLEEFDTDLGARPQVVDVVCGHLEI